MRPKVNGNQDGSVTISNTVCNITIDKPDIRDVAAEIVVRSNPDQIRRDSEKWICNRILKMSVDKLSLSIGLQVISCVAIILSFFVFKNQQFQNLALGTGMGLSISFLFCNIGPSNIRKVMEDEENS